MSTGLRDRPVVLRRGAYSVRFTARPARTCGALVVVVSALGVAGLLLGGLDLDPLDVVAAFAGTLDNPLHDYFVTDVRLPRVVTAAVVGMALGVSGSLFQQVTGNPLGSPDIIGFTTGAATGALVQIIVVGADTYQVALGALVGGMLTAGVVWLLTRSTALTGQRLVLVGLGVGTTLGAVNTLLVSRASLVAAQTAAQWLAGSLEATLWPRTGILCAVVAVLLVPAVLVARPLRLVVLGDDVARGAGVPVQGVRTFAVVIGVALVSVATAATGPLAFVALAAPQVSRRLAGTSTPGIVGPALTGAAIVLAADLVGQHLLPAKVTVGVVTGAVGGIYLIFLLASEARRRR